MEEIRKALGVSAEALGDRQVRVIVATSELDRARDVVEVRGIDLANFAALRTVLFNHDPDHPIAECVSIALNAGGALEALVQFPPEAVSAKSDEVYGLIKAGVINAASIGFVPGDVEARDGRDPKKGLRFLTGEMTEFSFVSVPANPGARVIERALTGEPSSGAEQDPAMVTREAKEAVVKDLYDVGTLCSILTSLGWLQSTTAWEAEYEGDESEIPARLAAALAQLGQVLVDMTAEEVAELVARHGGADDRAAEKAAATPVRKALLSFAEGRKAGDRVATIEKAGRTVSKANADALRDACATLLSAHDAVKAIAELGAANDDESGDGGVEKSAPAPAQRAPVQPVVRSLAQRRREIELLELDAA